jgi:hypothetical protein
MKKSKFFLMIFLLAAVSAAAFGAQAKKKVSGNTSLTGEPAAEKGQTGKGKKGTTQSGTTQLIIGEKDDIPKVLPTPPPDKAFLLIASPVPFAEVIINNTSKLKTNEKGNIVNPISLKVTKANVVFRHPDYHELSETVDLSFGKTKLLDLTPISKYGTVVLNGIPEQAKITIDGADPQAATTKRQVVDGQEGAGIDKNLKIEKATFARIPTGKHKLKIEHPDYKEWVLEMDVKPGEQKDNFIAPSLELVVAQLNVKPKAGAISALAGATIYVDDKEGGQVSPDGTLLVDNIRYKKTDNKYVIRVVKNGYLEHKEEMALAIGPNPFEVLLKPIPNSKQLSEYFNSGLGKWRTEDGTEAPKDWKIENVKGGDWLVVQGAPKLGFPKDLNYRDFNAEFMFQMPNAKGIAWAVRVQGAKYNDYYLFYLSGPQGKFPNQFRTYVSRNGVIDLSKPDQPPVQSIVKLSSEYIYTIRIEARGNTINTSIKPETGPDAKGRMYPICTFMDEGRPLLYGNIGFRTISGEIFMVKNLFVDPIENPKKN